MFHINYYLMFHSLSFLTNKFMYYSNALTYTLIIFKLGALIYPPLYPEDFKQHLVHRHID